MNAMDKAGGILGVAKKRELVAAGLTVVEKSRLEALERVAEFIKQHGQVIRDLISEQAVVDGYGSAICVNDPRDFVPDFEVCSPKEIEAWRQAVKRAQNGQSVEIPRHKIVMDDEGRMVAHISHEPWGIGTYTYRDEEMQRVLDDLDAILLNDSEANI